MLTGFQKYLVDKGFKRTCNDPCSKNEKEDYESTYLSSYNPLHYNFRKGDKYCYWGLCEDNKPPVMFLGNNKMYIIQHKENKRTKEDGFRILFSRWHEERFDEIYDVFMSDKKYFLINCEDENNISIDIADSDLPSSIASKYKSIIEKVGFAVNEGKTNTIFGFVRPHKELLERLENDGYKVYSIGDNFMCPKMYGVSWGEQKSVL